MIESVWNNTLRYVYKPYGLLSTVKNNKSTQKYDKIHTIINHKPFDLIIFMGCMDLILSTNFFKVFRECPIYLERNGAKQSLLHLIFIHLKLDTVFIDIKV